jgi:hypothetical protein
MVLDLQFADPTSKGSHDVPKAALKRNKHGYLIRESMWFNGTESTTDVM